MTVEERVDKGLLVVSIVHSKCTFPPGMELILDVDEYLFNLSIRLTRTEFDTDLGEMHSRTIVSWPVFSHEDPYKLVLDILYTVRYYINTRK